MVNFFKKKIQKPPTLEQYVQKRLDQGDTREQIQKDLLDDLDKGGPIFGDFKKAFQPTFPDSTKRFDDEYDEVLSRSGASGLYVWENCRGKNQNKYPICQDCLARHGQAKSKKEWEEAGLPRLGKTQCGDKCVCILTPKEMFDYKLKKGLV